MSLLPPEVPGPNPGQPGHFGHHDWITASLKALDDGGDLVPVPVPLVQVFQAGGTWAKPANLVYAVVEVQGGGGGSGGVGTIAVNQAAASGAGGGGGYARKTFLASALLASEPVAVGGGGGAGTSGGSAGGPGGASTFHGVTANGGGGGAPMTTTANAAAGGGAGGTATGGDFYVQGSDGDCGRVAGTGSGNPAVPIPARGGGSHFGGNTRTTGGSSNGSGFGGRAWGGGASGALGRSEVPFHGGSPGQAGIVVITSYVMQWVTAPPRP